MKPRTIHEAVDGLVNGKRILLFKDERGYNVRGDVPSLIEQLECAVSRQGNGNGGGKLGARPPIAVGVMQLLTEIASKAADAVKERDPNGKHLHNIPDNLRRIAADRAGLTTGDPELEKWIDQLLAWTAKARSALGLEPRYPKGLRGIPCPECGADSAPTVDDDGKAARAPALQFEWGVTIDVADDELPRDRKVRAVVCQMCAATWWAGEQFYDLQERIEQMLSDNLTHETLAQP